MSHSFQIFKLLRPRQWIKNLALFAALTFSGQMFDGDLFTKVFTGFLAFCFLSSSTYIINDIIDVKKDRLHPFKKARPIASGKVSVPEAFVVLFATLAVAYYLVTLIGGFFVGIALVYILLQLSYSFFFKNIVIFDIFFIAVGYILRVLAGDVISGYHISVWLLLTTISLSLFLAVGKRRSELTLLMNFQSAKITDVRRSLSHYSEPLLDTYTAMFAISTFVFYAMFTFLENPRGIQVGFDLLLPEYLPYYLQRKWLMVTIIPVLYGLMRYLQDIYEKKEGESPEKVLLSDKQLLSSVIIWVFLVVFIIYFIQGS